LFYTIINHSFFIIIFLSKQIQKYSENIQYSDPEQLIALKFDFIKIICGYEHYIPLNFPLRNSVDNPFEKLENLQKDFWLVPWAFVDIIAAMLNVLLLFFIYFCFVLCFGFCFVLWLFCF